MEVRTITRREFRKIIKSNGGYYIYEKDGKLIKFDKTYANDIFKFGDLYSHSIGIDSQQIEWLSSLNGSVKSSLPIGTINYNGIAVAVTYPHFFKGYSSLENVKDEEASLFLQNIRSAAEDNAELMRNGVYNNDFAFKNVLYRSSDVELIDLDGKHIKRKNDSNPGNVYTYFIDSLRRAVYFKLVSTHGVEQAKRIMAEIKHLFPDTSLYKEDTPIEIIDGIEKTKVLK